MKKVINIGIISLLLSSSLYANQKIERILKKIPLNISYLSSENGGSLNAIDAFL